jgi:hypothetical protein
LTLAGRPRILTDMPRWLLATRLAALLVVVAAVVAAVGSAGAANVITVRAPTVLQMAGSDVCAFVGGTHMAVVVAPAKGGGNAIGVLYLDGKGNAVVGTSTIGISNHAVTIVEVTGPTTTRVLYRHAVY